MLLNDVSFHWLFPPIFVCNPRFFIMIRVLNKGILIVNQLRTISTQFKSRIHLLPIKEEYCYTNKTPCQAWIDNLDSIQENKVGLIELHPHVFAAQPRIDIVQENVEWQRKYRFISFAQSKTRSEVRGGGRKPWPQKGLGRARHGSIRSPLFVGGGVAHGPRSPSTHFYMLPFYKRVMGLTSILSIKLAQNDLRIVNDLNIPTNNAMFLKDLIKERNWGPSALIVSEGDIFPDNICRASENLAYINLMPVYGLNIYSMLKHDTLVLTTAAIRKIEKELIYQLNRIDATSLGKKFKLNQI